MVGEEEAAATAVATVATADAESAEVRTTPVLATVAESKDYVPHLEITRLTTVRTCTPIR